MPRCDYYLGGGAAYPRSAFAPPLHGWEAAGPGNAPYAAPTSEEEASFLKDQAEAIKTELDRIESRIRDLESK